MKKTKKGFTLVELLVVIAIIAIIAAVAVPVTIGQINKSKKKMAVNEGNNAIDAVELALVDTNGGDIAALLEENFTNPEYVTQITITAGVVTVVYNDNAQSATPPSKTLSNFTGVTASYSYNAAPTDQNPHWTKD